MYYIIIYIYTFIYIFFFLEAEHGYASNAPISDRPRNISKKPKTKKSQGSRTTHNELEKNR